MTRTMGDSVDINKVPHTVDIVATYADGHFGVVIEQLLEELFPPDKYFHVLIDVNGSRPDVHVRDWETGDKAGDLRQWVIDHNNHTRKKDAVVYCDRSTIAEVRRLTGDQILGKDYYLWVATLDGDIVRGEGIVACQDKGARQNGSNFDTSVVFDLADKIWPSPKTPSSPGTPPPPKPDCRSFQRALRAHVDGLWGPDTDKHATALIKSWGDEFPFGVTFAQRVVGTRGDGAWGPVSKRARDLTTANVQRALKSMGFDPGKIDGIWGEHTHKAYNKARTACHI